MVTYASGFPAGWRISVIDELLKSTYPVHYPKYTTKRTVVFTTGDIEHVQETMTMPHYPFFDSTLYSRRREQD